MKYLLISIHDVTPFYERQVKKFVAELKKRNIKKYSILIIPSMNDKFNSPNEYDIIKYPKFIRDLKRLELQGCELMMHGLDHTDGKYITNPVMIEKRIKLALSKFKKAFGKKPDGYVPPVWITSKKQDAILKKYFLYTEDKYKITYFKKKKIYGPPIGMESFTSNKYLKYDKITPLITRYYSKTYANIHTGEVLRYSLHPRELDNGNFKHTLKLLDKLLNNGWTPITYAQLYNKL